MGTERIELSPNANREAGQLNTYVDLLQRILKRAGISREEWFDVE